MNRVLLLFMSLVLILLNPVTIYANDLISTVDVRGDGTLRRTRVPVLMYHYVSVLPDGADSIRRNLTVSPELFRQHLRYLKDNGYETISLHDMDQALIYGIELPEKPVILTFDDGHLDHYTNVFPILREFEYTATFFIITSFADNNNPDHLNWDQIEEMAAAGMSIQPHTKTHSTLNERDYDFLVYEILGSIESIASHIGQQPTSFAYPVGRYDYNTLRIIDTTQITRSVTTQLGTLQTTSNEHEVPRLRISNDTTVAGLAYLLNLP